MWVEINQLVPFVITEHTERVESAVLAGNDKIVELVATSKLEPDRTQIRHGIIRETNDARARCRGLRRINTQRTQDARFTHISRVVVNASVGLRDDFHVIVREPVHVPS